MYGSPLVLLLGQRYRLGKINVYIVHACEETSLLPRWLLTTTWAILFFGSFLYPRLRQALKSEEGMTVTPCLPDIMDLLHQGINPKAHSFLSQLCSVISREKSCWAKEFIFFPFKIYAFRTSWFHGNYHFLLSFERRWQHY